MPARKQIAARTRLFLSVCYAGALALLVLAGALAGLHPLFYVALAVPSALRGEVLPSHGGMPITVKGRVIGGIGCGGGTGEQDHECAVAGAATLAG